MVSVGIRLSDWTKLGSVIRDARRARGLSQHDLAGRAGVSRSWLARLETGHRGAELEPLFRLLAALNLTISLRDDRRSDDGQTAADASARDQPPADYVARPSAARGIEPDWPNRRGDAAVAPETAAPHSVLAKHQAAAARRRQAWRDAATSLERSGTQAAMADDSDVNPAGANPAHAGEGAHGAGGRR